MSGAWVILIVLALLALLNLIIATAYWIGYQVGSRDEARRQLRKLRGEEQT